MAFDYTNLYPDTSGNGGYTKSWNYTTVTDSIATCSASGYFNKVATRLGIGDNIVIARVDAFPTSARTALIEYATLYVSGIAGGIVTTLPSTTGLATTAYVDAVAANAANASNLTSGTVPSARLPSPTSSTLGGVTSAVAVSHNFLTGIGTNGIPTAGQPDATDVTFTSTATGALARGVQNRLQDMQLASDFLHQDGILLTGTVTIASGSPNLLVVGASYVSGDVGKIIFVEGAGTTGGWLQSTILSVTDATHVVLNNNASTTVSAASKRVLYGTDDATGIANIITAIQGGSSILFARGGHCLHSNSPNWAYKYSSVSFLGDDFEFWYTGAGTKAHQWDGMAIYPATQGCLGARFGGPGTPKIHGNPKGTTTDGAWVDNYHSGHLQFRPRDVVNGLHLNDSGIVGSSAVGTRFEKIKVSNNTDGAFIVQPNAGVVANKAVACTWNDLLIEGCGSGAGAFQLIGCIDNSLRGVISQSNGSKGLTEDSASSRNTFTNVHCESNTTSEFSVAGKHTILDNCTGAVVASSFSGTGAILRGGSYQAVTETDNTFYSVNTEYYGTCSLTGTNRVIIAPQGTAAGVTAIAVDFSGATPGNKIYNTDNTNTIQIASIDIATAWATYTPTITAGAGTATTVSATGRYKQVGKVVTAEVDVTITTVGTASGGLNFSLPVNSRASRYVGSSFEYGATGKGGAAYINGPSTPSVAVTKAADGTTFWASGNAVAATVTYEIT